MQAVIPAAGRGTRMQPLTDDRPKGLVEVAGKPLLTYVFETLTELGVEELVVIVGYRGDQIQAQYGDGFDGTPITYVRQESRDGLAHALLQARPAIDGDFLLLNGDNVLRANTDAVLARHRRSEAPVTSLVERVSPQRAGRGGVFELDGDAIVGLVEKPDKPPSQLIPRGFYSFSERIFPACELVRPSETGEYELSAAIDLLLTAGWSLETVELDGWCYNVNTPEDCNIVAEKLARESLEQ